MWLKRLAPLPTLVMNSQVFRNGQVFVVRTVSTRQPGRFVRSQTGSFLQDPPRHENVFNSDIFLQRCLVRLCRKIPDLYDSKVFPDLSRFGDRVSEEIWNLGRACEIHPPTLACGGTDAWGKTATNPLVTCNAWKKQKAISAEEGLISIAYSGNGTGLERLHQVSKLYLYAASSGLFSCPLAMTDGAATVLKPIRNENLVFNNAFENLTTTSPETFWTSGQWMTEKKGGSDVASGTQTVATSSHRGDYLLSGYKWFSSATDSDMALTLARIVRDDGTVTSGTSGISMFYLETKSNGKLNNIEVFKLKNKLGTRQLPTAELLLDGTPAILVSEPGQGIKSIAPMLTVTRMHNVIASVSSQRKIVSLARDYSNRRVAFGQPLRDHFLHLETLLNLETEVRGCSVLMLDLARQLGLEENGLIDERDQLLLRLMMPVAKGFTAKAAVANVSEGLECFGGQGYIEDTGLPSMLRDAQVLPIWEGTTNVMALDVVRAIVKTKGKAWEAFVGRVGEVVDDAIARTNDGDLKKAAVKLDRALKGLIHHEFNFESVEDQVMLRDFLFSLANVYVGALLVEHASFYPDSKNDASIALRWTTQRDLVPVLTKLTHDGYIKDRQRLHDLVFEGYDPSATYELK